MKIRIKGNTIRFRLTQPEVVRLRGGASLRDSTEFGPAQLLTWVLQPAPAVSAIEASFRDATISVRLPDGDVRSWADTDTVGLYGQSGALEVAVEKDFRCLSRAGSAEEAGAFPNPHEGGKC
ncbi:MAG: hypothetical protein ABSF98_20445 [Bryobacteraceae bacterium]|jgi:hypothetical protein